LSHEISTRYVDSLDDKGVLVRVLSLPTNIIRDTANLNFLSSRDREKTQQDLAPNWPRSKNVSAKSRARGEELILPALRHAVFFSAGLHQPGAFLPHLFSPGASVARARGLCLLSCHWHRARHPVDHVPRRRWSWEFPARRICCAGATGENSTASSPTVS